MKVTLAAAILLLHALVVGCSPALTKRDTIQSGSEIYSRTLISGAGSSPNVEYFLSSSKEQLPLILYVQGSGCNPVFFQMGRGGAYASTVFSLTTIARETKLPVMVVSKPYAPAAFPATPDSAEGCPHDFNQSFDLTTWVVHIRKAMDHAQTEHLYNPSKVLVIGFSEGATVAAALAAVDTRVTHVALVGGSGTTQLFDFIVARYLRGQNDDARLTEINELNVELTKILADPLSGEKFAWGHAYRRWSSFFMSNSLENLMHSHAKVYVVSGMADKSVPIISTEALVSGLQVAGRDLVVRRLPDANHALMREGPGINQIAAMDGAEDEYRRIAKWFCDCIKHGSH